MGRSSSAAATTGQARAGAACVTGVPGTRPEPDEAGRMVMAQTAAFIIGAEATEYAAR